jgi:hypothetical protein
MMCGQHDYEIEVCINVYVLILVAMQCFVAIVPEIAWT